MSHRKLTNREEKFVEEMANPQTKSAAEAARKAGYSTRSARELARKALTKVDVLQQIEQRKLEAAKHFQVTREAVMGATAQRAFATIDDAFDETGRFDMEKARRTGAIHLVKSITRTPNQFGESVKV